MFSQIAEEVAILPARGSLSRQVLEIAKVAHRGEVFIQLADGRMYATLGGAGLNTNTCIVPADNEHREALTEKNGDGSL
jgi:hypothetical protein